MFPVSDDSCQVIFGLNFCTDVAYAVPSSLQFKTNTTGLAALYDTQAASYFRNFSRSLAQIPCDTTSTAQYSLARTCDDCAADYKSWLCSVLLPRCEDFSASDPWLQERNIATPFANGTLPYANNMTQEFREQKRDRFAYSRSRNKMIDDVIKPGPYKELLPCEDLCFDIVRSCPAQLGFQCPDREARALQYGKRDLEDQRVLKCNFPGAVVDLNTFRAGAERRGEVKLGLVVGVALAVVGTVGNSWL
jgi:calcium channel MID1